MYQGVGESWEIRKAERECLDQVVDGQRFLVL